MSDFVVIRYSDQVAVLSPNGGLAQYYISDKDQKHDVIYGYDSISSQDGGMGDILSPWPGRLGDQKYDWNGEHYDVTGSVESVDDNNNALHGYARKLKWSIERVKDNIAVSRATLDEQKGYPFKLSYEITYELGERGLTITDAVKNIGEKDAPFGLGHHPYFTIDGAQADDLELQVPSETLVEFDSTKKPTGGFINVKNDEKGQKLDFTTFNKVASLVIDNCFTSLKPDADGLLHSSVRYNNKTVTMWQEAEKYPYIVVYTFDGSKKGHKRKAIAIEPMTCCGFAFNYPELGLINLKAGTEFKGKWGIHI